MSWHVGRSSNSIWGIWLNLKQLLQNALCNTENYVVIHRFCQWYRHFQSSSVGSTIVQVALRCWVFWRCFIGFWLTLTCRAINVWMRKSIGSIFLKKIKKKVGGVGKKIVSLNIPDLVVISYYLEYFMISVFATCALLFIVFTVFHGVRHNFKPLIYQYSNAQKYDSRFYVKKQKIKKSKW